MPQIAYIYKDAHGDCSNGGISSRCNHVMAFGQDEPFNRHYGKSFAGQPVEAVRLCPGPVAGQVIARPIDPIDGEPLRGMFGGCLIGASDSRFSEMVESISPSWGAVRGIVLHDRFE